MSSSIPGLSVPVPTVVRRMERLSRETKSHPQSVLRQYPNSYRLRRRNSRFETFAIFAHSKPRLAIRAISASFSLRLSSSFLWWTLTAGVIAFALFSLEFSGRAVVDELPHRPPRYPCEDVSGYYSQVEHAEDVKMMQQLKLSSSSIQIGEHLWPRSYGLARGPSLTGLHNLRPADVNAEKTNFISLSVRSSFNVVSALNSSRGNKFYGECLHEDNSSLRPENSEAAPDTEKDKERWAPPVQFVEVVSSPIDVSRLKLVLYNGANGKMCKSIPLTGEEFSVTSEGLEFLIYTAPLSLQNGPADGIALVSCIDDGTDEVIQFLSYEGVTTAIDGAAVGTRSLETGVKETEDSSKLGSLGLTGNGLRKFQWKRFTTNGSPARLNPGQDLGEP